MLRDSYSSTFRGVTWSKRHGKWQAGISLQGSYLYLGAFYSEEEAARMWDLAALKFRGNTTCTNFAVTEYLDSRGNVVKHAKLDTALNNLRAKRAAETAVTSEQPGVGGAMAAAAALETERGTIGACNTLNPCAAAAAADTAVGAAKASTKKSAKRRKQSTALCIDPIYVLDSPCTTHLSSSGMLPSSSSAATAVAAAVVADNDYAEDVWSQLEKSTALSASSSTLAAAGAGVAAVSVTQTGSLASSRTSCTTPVACLCQESMADDNTIDAVAGLQQQRSNTLQQQEHHHHQQQLSGYAFDFSAVADLTYLAQPPQLPLQQQQQCESQYRVLPYIGSTSNTAAAEVLLAAPDVEELLLPQLSDLMQAEATPAHALTQHAHYSSSSSSSSSSTLASISQLLLLGPGYQVVNMLSAGSAVFCAVLVAAYPRSGLVRVMPWRAYVWEPAGWQQLGAYAAEGDARQACSTVLGLLSSC